MNIQLFWDMVSCRLADSYRCFVEACCFHFQGLFGERRVSSWNVCTLSLVTASYSEQSLLVYQLSRRSIPEELEIKFKLIPKNRPICTQQRWNNWEAELKRKTLECVET
jgi:hypothetical protein